MQEQEQLQTQPSQELVIDELVTQVLTTLDAYVHLKQKETNMRLLEGDCVRITYPGPDDSDDGNVDDNRRVNTVFTAL